ncbi:hypothetical protein WJX84_001598 [Apatococcus fuscideae]|uniref:CBS domain-containing protein n=1 Tax=Apatococcus fuscideae TaxID=2026836 RepID=A0AAW1T5I5_9CHLO
MESNGSLQLIVPIMVAVFAAKMTGDALCLGFYEVQIKMRGAPTLLEPNLNAHQAMVSDKLHVHELMTTQLLALAPVGKVKDVVNVLQQCQHQAFPVTPDVKGAWQAGEAFPLHGMLRRTLLLRLLKHRVGMFHWDGRGPIPLSSSQVAHDQQARLKVLEKLEQIPLKIRAFVDQDQIFKDMTEEEMDMHMDLRPYMQRVPFLVHANASLSRAYRLFRTMGLHTLYVGQAKPLVMGVITRKDIIEENAELVLGKKAHEGVMLEGALANSPRPAPVPFIPETSGYAEYTAPPPGLDSIREEPAAIELGGSHHGPDDSVGLLSAARVVMRTLSSKRPGSPLSPNS